MSEFLEPANDFVLVVDLPHTAMIDGIALPDNERQKEMLFGVVASTGPLVSIFTHPRDKVMFGPYAGKMTVIDGTEFRLLREGQIEGYIRERQTNTGTTAGN